MTRMVIFYFWIFIFSFLTISFQAFPQGIESDTAARRLEEVVIESDYDKSKSTIKLAVPIKDVPFTINTISSNVLKQQGADDMISAMRNATGVNPVSTYGGFQQFIIRGFSDFLLLIDGFRDERHNLSQSAPMSNNANIDRIEVLKGPSSVLFGHSALGGVMNVIRKKPSAVPSYEFSSTLGSFGAKRMTMGAAGPIVKNLLYRLDLGISEESGWRGAGNSRSTGYVALSYTPTHHDELLLQVGLNKDLYDNDAGIPSINGKIPDELASTRYNVPQDFLKFGRIDLQARYSHHFTSALKLSNQIAYAIDDINYLSTETLLLNAAQDSVQRGYFNFNHQTKPFQNTLELSYDASHLLMPQKFLVGYSLNILDRKTYWDQPLRSQFASQVSLTDPVENQGPVEVKNTTVRNIAEIMQGFYFQNWIKLHEKLKLLAGLRYDLLRGSYHTDVLATEDAPATSGAKTNRNSAALTYRFGAAYQLLQSFSFYGSYSTYFKPARQVPADAKKLIPEQGHQYELGMRLDAFNICSFNAAVYHIVKENMVVSLGKGLYDQAGKSQSSGVEIDLTLNPYKGFQCIGGYSYNLADYVKYESGGVDLKGKKLQYAPDHQVHAWASYTKSSGILKGLGIGAGGNLVGDAFADSENQIKMPNYLLFNSALFYQVGKAELSVKMNNIFNRNYIVSAINDNQLYPGMPRNFLMSLRFKM